MRDDLISEAVGSAWKKQVKESIIENVHIYTIIRYCRATNRKNSSVFLQILYVYYGSTIDNRAPQPDWKQMLH